MPQIYGVEKTVAWLLNQPGLSLLARLALASAFLVSGLSKTLDFSGAVDEVRGLTGIEPAGLIAVVVIAIQIGGSVLVIWGGRWTWLGAGLLAGFTLLATLLAHSWWTKSGVDRIRDFNTFFEHVGLVGGFILAAILASRNRGDIPIRRT
jgi:uncharacterized membrane protein YphA (DoxX/SURF4 family)